MNITNSDFSFGKNEWASGGLQLNKEINDTRTIYVHLLLYACIENGRNKTQSNRGKEKKMMKTYPNSSSATITTPVKRGYNLSYNFFLSFS